MEHMIMTKQPTYKSPTPSMLSLHRDSRPITKVKPKIRIIHIFAPEIIKTDVENFRELVQRLTGKPSDLDSQGRCKKKVKLGVPRKEETRILQDNEKSMMGRKMEPRDHQKVVKKEEGMFMMRINNNNINSTHGIGENFSGGYLNEFADLDGFIQELGGLPMSPVDLERR